jgi:hypothetical protein
MLNCCQRTPQEITTGFMVPSQQGPDHGDMKSLATLQMAIGIGFLSAIMAAAVAGAGVAQAASSPSVVGQKYSDARAALSGAGFAILVSSTVGDQTAWPDCVVTRQQDRTVPPPENTGGSASNQTLLALNCDAQVASAKSPGNSLASPVGRAAAASAAASTKPAAPPA